MGKKEKKKQQIIQPDKEIKIVGISKRGKITIFAGILTVVLGFIVLTQTDPAGANLASHISPFLLIAGYAIIAVGIILPEKNQSLPQPGSCPEKK